MKKLLIAALAVLFLGAFATTPVAFAGSEKSQENSQGGGNSLSDSNSTTPGLGGTNKGPNDNAGPGNNSGVGSER